MRSALLLLTICLAFFSCKKNGMDSADILACHQSQNFDSTAVANRVTGEWLFSSRFCYKVTPSTLMPLEVKATINTNGSFIVTQQKSIVEQGNWTLKPLGTGFWGFQLSSPSEYLNGRIIFCENKVLFNTTYSNANGEGCEVQFYKK
jgi:hypothetical protein